MRAHLTKRSANAMLEDNQVKHDDSPMERKTKINMTAEKHNHRVVFFNGYLAVHQIYNKNSQIENKAQVLKKSLMERRIVHG